MTVFPDPDAFTALYPERPGLMTHLMAGHPLFTLDALVELSRQMPPEDVEYNRGDLPLGIAFDDVPANGISVADTIRGIEENGSWMVLKSVEQNEAYRRLMTDALAELDVPINARTGPMLRQEAFIFISSPNSVTPLHFDPEHNILLQLRGTKTMMTFDGDDEDIAPPQAHEKFYLGTAHRNLPWNDAYLARGQRFQLAAGDGIYVPLMAPHWVRNGPDVSISFSMTWRSLFSYAEADARGMNALLRRAGLNPASPARFPARNRAKALGFRAVRRVRHLLRRD